MPTYRASYEAERIKGLELCEKYGLDPDNVREITVIGSRVTAVVYERDENGRPIVRDDELVTRVVRVRP